MARNLTTGAEKNLFETTATGSHNVIPSHDGTLLALHTWSLLSIHDLRTGQSREIYRAPQDGMSALWSLAWTADDRQLVSIVRPGTTADKMEMWTFSPEGGEPVRRAVPKGYRGISLSSDGKHFATTILTSRQQVWALENFLPAQPK